MAENKTKASDASVEDYIASKATAAQHADCQTLMRLFEKVLKVQPRMWGSSIVGYGAYRYTYESGRSGESCRTGFAIRGKELVVYLVAEGRQQASLLQKLGKHRMGKSCLYLKQLADIDESVLEQLVTGSVATLQRRYGPADGA